MWMETRKKMLSKFGFRNFLNQKKQGWGLLWEWRWQTRPASPRCHPYCVIIRDNKGVVLMAQTQCIDGVPSSFLDELWKIILWENLYWWHVDIVETYFIRQFIVHSPSLSVTHCRTSANLGSYLCIFWFVEKREREWII